MIEGARQLPLHHITIRVPWHDNGWTGTFCNNPCGNTSCTVLNRIAEKRDDDYETRMAGKSIEGLEDDHLPPCVNEHGTIMATFPIPQMKRHPYAEGAKVTHGHFAETPYVIPPYSAATIPFRWMLCEQIEGDDDRGVPSRADQFQFDYRAEREPDLTVNGWKDDSRTWIQEGTNQRVVLDTFFSAVKKEESLVFFYAKRTPLAEDARRVIVGVGRVSTVGNATEYRYEGGKKPADKMSGYLWERNVEHSIRPGETDGFLLPYQDLMTLAENDDSIDLTPCTAFAPAEYFEQYSYGSELLPHDGAIASLLAVEKAITHMRELLDAPWDAYLEWIDRQLNRLWQARGAFPGLGAALGAFGLPHGNLLAWHLVGSVGATVDPWTKLVEALRNPQALPEHLRDGLGKTWQLKWEKLRRTKRDLLMLLARFNLTNEQAERWYQDASREEAGIALTDEQILANPYLIFENDRHQPNPIPFAAIDRGLFPPKVLRKQAPIPPPSRIPEAIDPRRVRAVMIQALEDAAVEGHTFLPSRWVIERVRDQPMKPKCPLDEDTIAIVEDDFDGRIVSVAMENHTQGFQLDRFAETTELISKKIKKRASAKRIHADLNWRELVDSAIDLVAPDKDSDDLAREEKAAALKEVFGSRVSVLLGGAGTGKSTLLKALCSIPAVRDSGVLLLAPTGKARVRMEQASGMLGHGLTLAQFLLRFQRYDGATGRYFVRANTARSSAYKTVIVDECSMLTEEQLAALLDAVTGVDRLVLVGDPQQLPPIGAGRPYFDIVQYVQPAHVGAMFPRVGPGYAELTVTMRQSGDDHSRRDLVLANIFSGRAQDPAADEVWGDVGTGGAMRVDLVRWDQPGQVQKLLMGQLRTELQLVDESDEPGFERSLGGAESEYDGKRYVYFNPRRNGTPGAADKVENWQVLAPTRNGAAGVAAVNRAIQQHFRKVFFDLAAKVGYMKKIPVPAGPEAIIYGDKVINLINDGRRRVYPGRDPAYVANGDIGIVVGPWRKPKSKTPLSIMNVEFASQPGFSYTYPLWEFDGQEGTPPLELAYALTIHKTQGSEFNTTFVIIPNPCRMLSRELLYTALTRHKGKIVILHQGEFRNLLRYAHDDASEIRRRMTRLFIASQPVPVTVRNKTVFLDEHLIYRTEQGELVRSKSEWIIADKLHHAGIGYQYEQALKLAGVERYPDFTIRDDDTDVTWYWEHNGMLGNRDYEERWKRKLAAYREAGIRPLGEGGGENGTLLVTEEKTGVGLDADVIEANIRAIRGT